MTAQSKSAGRGAIVTGGASGIGRAVIAQLLGRGYQVVCADRDRAAMAALAKSEPRVMIVDVDVTDQAAVTHMVAEAERAFGPPAVLVHSAGVGIERAFLDTTHEEWSRILDIDLTGTFLVCQAIARRMVQQKFGRIVVMASTAGLRGGTGRAAYGAAKGGVIALTRVMAVELAGFGVTVNALAPGPIETELVARMHSQATRTVYTRAVPLARYGTTEEVAAAAVFLASDEASYITGQILGVDGGFLAAGVMA